MNMKSKSLAACFGLSLALLATGARAASEDAWTEFRKSVETACLKAVAGNLQGATAVVDPFGSESFGLALLRGKPKGAKQPVAVICVYDKKRQTVEIGGELDVPK